VTKNTGRLFLDNPADNRIVLFGANEAVAFPAWKDEDSLQGLRNEAQVVDRLQQLRGLQ